MACLAVLLLAVHTALLAWSAYRHSPVMSEVGHLPAGISHWQFGRFDLYRVNPPLARMVAALPVMLAGPAVKWSTYSTDPLTRSETTVGIDFVNANGFRTFWLYTLGRWACIPFSLAGAWICYRWARELYGAAAGLAAMALWCFCPNILGNAPLIMPDVPAAALAVAACYTFWHWLKQPTWRRAILTGLVLGIAELTKTTLLVFYPLWPVLWLVYRLPDRKGRSARTAGDCPDFAAYSTQNGTVPLSWAVWLREAGMLLVTAVLSVYIINLGYGFEGSGRTLRDYRFQSRMLAGAPKSDRALVAGNRFGDSFLGSLPLPLPANYVQGIDAQKVDFERGMRSYLHGEWRDRGWWYFYLYGLAIKVPLGTWLLVFLAGGISLARCRRMAVVGCAARTDLSQAKSPSIESVLAEHPTSTSAGGQHCSWRDEMLVLLPAAALLALVSSQTGFSIHFRYVLPMFPFLFIWASKSALLFHALVRPTACRPLPAGPLPTAGRRLPAMLVVAALAWSIASSLYYYPHSLSYFNELVGGPAHGHEHLLDSSIAWGQDLLYLKEWYDAHPEARPFYLAHFGFVNPEIAGIAFALPPLRSSEAGDAKEDATEDQGLQPGWYAIDVNYLRGSALRPLSPSGRFADVPARHFDLSRFQRFAAVADVSYATRIFHLTDEDVQRGCVESAAAPRQWRPRPRAGQ
ncbi:MAG: glycosyltransferase family 39 protein [Planctomycetia bacterium]|nr:glycosyltransferase family 39 protein [Planctomycetia bacterium]